MRPIRRRLRLSLLLLPAILSCTGNRLPPRSTGAHMYVHVTNVAGLRTTPMDQYDAMWISVVMGRDAMPGTLVVFVTHAGQEYRFTNGSAIVANDTWKRLVDRNSVIEPLRGMRYVSLVRAVHIGASTSTYACSEYDVDGRRGGLLFACFLDTEREP